MALTNKTKTVKMTIKSYSATHGNYAVTIDNYVVDNSTGKVVYINGGKIVKNDITSTFALGLIAMGIQDIVQECI